MEPEKTEEKETEQTIATQEPVQNTNQEEFNTTVVVKKSKAKLIIIICIILILIAGGAAGYIYYMQINKPINKFAKLSNQFFNTMISQFSSEDNSTGINDKLAAILNGKFSANVKLSANVSDLSYNDSLSSDSSDDLTSYINDIKNQIGNYELNLTYEKDKQNKEQSLDISYTDKDAGETYNPYKVFNSGDNYGISLSEIYDKILTFTKTDLTDNGMEDVATVFDSILNMDYSTAISTTDTNYGFTNDEINTILNNLKPVYDKYLTEDKFTEQKNINENKDSEITITMTEADFGNFLKDTFSVLKDNEDVKKIIADKLGLTEDYSTYNDNLSEIIDDVTQEYTSTTENITVQVVYKDNTIKSITFNFLNGSVIITNPESGTFGVTVNNTDEDTTVDVMLKKNDDNDYTISYSIYDSEDNKVNISLGIKYNRQIVSNTAVNMACVVTLSVGEESSDEKINFAGQLNANMTIATIDKVEMPDTFADSGSLFDEDIQTDLANTIDYLATNNPDELMRKLPILGQYYIMSRTLFQAAQDAEDAYQQSIENEQNDIDNFQQSLDDMLNNYYNNSVDENY